MENPESLPHLQHTTLEQSLIEQIASEQTETQLQEIAHQVCSPPERQVLSLVMQDESMEMVAQMLHPNPNTVRTHLMRARAKILAHIIQYCPEMVGGREGIQQAIAKAQANAPPKERLSNKELDALM